MLMGEQVKRSIERMDLLRDCPFISPGSEESETIREATSFYADAWGEVPEMGCVAVDQMMTLITATVMALTRVDQDRMMLDPFLTTLTAQVALVGQELKRRVDQRGS